MKKILLTAAAVALLSTPAIADPAHNCTAPAISVMGPYWLHVVNGHQTVDFLPNQAAVKNWTDIVQKAAPGKPVQTIFDTKTCTYTLTTAG